MYYICLSLWLQEEALVESETRDGSQDDGSVTYTGQYICYSWYITLIHGVQVNIWKLCKITMQGQILLLDLFIYYIALLSLL